MAGGRTVTTGARVPLVAPRRRPPDSDTTLPRVRPEEFLRSPDDVLKAIDDAVARDPSEATWDAVRNALQDVLHATGRTMADLFPLPAPLMPPPPHQPQPQTHLAPPPGPPKRTKGRKCEDCDRFANYGHDSKRWCAEHARVHAGARRL